MPKKIDHSGSKTDVKDNFQKEVAVSNIELQKSLRPRMVCPRCKAGNIEYDGMLNLVCPNCGLTETGACT